MKELTEGELKTLITVINGGGIGDGCDLADWQRRDMSEVLSEVYSLAEKGLIKEAWVVTERGKGLIRQLAHEEREKAARVQQ